MFSFMTVMEVNIIRMYNFSDIRLINLCDTFSSSIIHRSIDELINGDGSSCTKCLSHIWDENDIIIIFFSTLKQVYRKLCILLEMRGSHDAVETSHF